MLLTPASTRAVLARLGIKSTCDLGDGEAYRVGPEQMPGEIKWRAEWLDWFSKMLTLQLLEKSPEKRLESVRTHYQLLVTETGLHPTEALAVVERGLAGAKAASTRPKDGPAELLANPETAEKIYMIRKSLLDERFVKMLRKHATRLDDPAMAVKKGKRSKLRKSTGAANPVDDAAPLAKDKTSA